MNVPYKLATAGSLALAGLIANQVVDKGWKLFTGHESPQGENEDEAKFVELIVFAMVSGVLVAVTRRYALKGTKKFFGNSIEA
ncbi:MAG: DUF4235 domain-containing protein [Actinomycetaceae bacterium]|nr:DUF4235 domain-containing protein [Actinomycetaceae bacterium]